MATLKDPGVLKIGNTGLMLNIITPLQKFSKGGTTLSDVVRQRYQDLFQKELTHKTLQEVEDYFTKKREVSLFNKNKKIGRSGSTTGTTGSSSSSRTITKVKQR